MFPELSTLSGAGGSPALPPAIPTVLCRGYAPV